MTVLRLEPGVSVELFDGQGRSAAGVVASINGGRVSVQVVHELEVVNVQDQDAETPAQTPRLRDLRGDGLRTQPSELSLAPVRRVAGDDRKRRVQCPGHDHVSGAQAAALGSHDEHDPAAVVRRVVRRVADHDGFAGGNTGARKGRNIHAGVTQGIGL